MTNPTQLGVHEVLQVIRLVLRLPATEMATRAGLTVKQYRMLEQGPTAIPNTAWNRLMAGMAIVDAVFGGDTGSGIAQVAEMIRCRIDEIEGLDDGQRAVEMQRIRLELAWIDDGG